MRWPLPTLQRSTILSRTVAALGVVLVSVIGSFAAGPPGQELIQLPVRWCAVRGGEAQANPGAVGEASTNDYLWRRHERPSDHVWIPGANITFRSAFAAAMAASSSFPIIDDPNPPGTGGPGQEGDILDPNIDQTEVKLAWAACNAAWDALAKAKGIALVGFIGINMRSFVGSNGEPAFTKGFGGADYTYSGGVINLCSNPPLITAGAFNWNGHVAISDYSLTRGLDPFDLYVAHEFGHAMSLDHGNGLDDDQNGKYDLTCDPAENVNALPFSVMTTGNNTSDVVAPLQRGTVRPVAMRVTGAQVDPPAALVNGDTVSDQRTDAVQDVLAEDVDLASVAFANVLSTRTSVISYLLFGRIPREEVQNQYLFFADLDNNPASGGTPADLGFKTSFAGAELVTRVVVGPGHTPTVTVWVYQNGKFEEVKRDFRARISSMIDGEMKQPISDIVTLEIPDDVRGPMATDIRIQAIAQQLRGAREFDILPNGRLDGSVPMHFGPPKFPVCNAVPPQVHRGGRVMIEVSGLIPNKRAHVVLGDVLVANGNTDGNGDAAIPVQLPGDTRLGPRLVTVGADGTALTADCQLDVRE